VERGAGVDAAVVQTRLGAVRGGTADGVLTFTGIRCAAPPFIDELLSQRPAATHRTGPGVCSPGGRAALPSVKRRTAPLQIHAKPTAG
jgi:hypothetical protein